jgi:Putative DNA-binding domain
MNLLSLQRRMAHAVMTPLTPSEGMRRVSPNGRPMCEVTAEFIKPNDRLTSFERLEIYNRQYWFRVLSSFAEDFPGLRAVLGGHKFNAVAKAYLSNCPSRSFTLRNLCSRLESWLRRHPGWAGSRQALAVDMVRLEWADIEAFDGKAEPALKPKDLAEADASKLRLRLQPYLQLLDLRYPVDDLLLGVRGDEDTEFSSNAFTERRKRKRVLAVAKLKPASIFLAVYRLDQSVYFRRLDCEEFIILNELRAGKILNRAIDTALRKSSIPLAKPSARIQRWFHTYAALGWFCQPKNKVIASQTRIVPFEKAKKHE